MVGESGGCECFNFSTECLLSCEILSSSVTFKSDFDDLELALTLFSPSRRRDEEDMSISRPERDEPFDDFFFTRRLLSPWRREALSVTLD